MKQQAIHQEILMFTGTGFSNRELREKSSNPEMGTNLSPAEKLEKACWDGLLYEMLPGIVECPSPKGMSYIWEITHGEKFIRISMGMYPQAVENQLSIDPYFFLETIYCN